MKYYQIQVLQIMILYRKEMQHRFGLSIVFMATRSGLTRWQDVNMNFDDKKKQSPLPPSQPSSEGNSHENGGEQGEELL